MKLHSATPPFASWIFAIYTKLFTLPFRLREFGHLLLFLALGICPKLHLLLFLLWAFARSFTFYFFLLPAFARSSTFYFFLIPAFVRSLTFCYRGLLRQPLLFSSTVMTIFCFINYLHELLNNYNKVSSSFYAVYIFSLS